MANRFGTGRVIKSYSLSGRFSAYRRRAMFLRWLVRFEILKLDNARAMRRLDAEFLSL